jgi:hypothetical protein
MHRNSHGFFPMRSQKTFFLNQTLNRFYKGYESYYHFLLFYHNTLTYSIINNYWHTVVLYDVYIYVCVHVHIMLF